MQRSGGHDDQTGPLELERAAFERCPDAVVVVDSTGTIAGVNPAFAELAGRAREDLVGRPFASALGAAPREKLAAIVAQSSAGGAREGELAVTLVDRGPRRLEWMLIPGLGGGRVLVTLRDVTERIRKVEAYERYELLSRHAHDIVLFLRRDGRIVEANDAAVTAYGFSREELLERTIRDLRAPGTRDGIDEQVETAFGAGILFETLHCRKDGSVFPVEVGSRAAMIGGERMLLSIIRDITGRSQMQAKLIQADRMAAVGTMAAGIAHEINNPLAYAIVNLQVARKKLAKIGGAIAERSAPGAAEGIARELGEVLGMLDLAHEGTERVRTIVGDLRSFARLDDATTGPADLPPLLETALNMASSEIRRRARLVRAFGDAPAVEANPSRLVQVFLNLLVNAAQAIPEGDVEANEIRVVLGTAPSGGAFVEVHDTGTGIAKEVLAQIFEPFFTTKPLGEGTGLGLFIARSIVVSAGGDIRVESEPGRGTRVRVTLPAAVGRAPSEAAGQGAARHRRILVADADVELAATLRRRLDGDKVVSAASAAEAMALFEDDPAFDLVLCAMTLPDGTGIELRDQVARKRPAVAARFILVASADEPAPSCDAASRAGLLYLRRPFDPDDVRALLAARDRR